MTDAMTAALLCEELNELLHDNNWAEANSKLHEAIQAGHSAPLLMSLIMVSTGASEHLPAREAVLLRILEEVGEDSARPYLLRLLESQKTRSL